MAVNLATDERFDKWPRIGHSCVSVRSCPQRPHPPGAFSISREGKIVCTYLLLTDGRLRTACEEFTDSLSYKEPHVLSWLADVGHCLEIIRRTESRMRRKRVERSVLERRYLRYLAYRLADSDLVNAEAEAERLAMVASRISTNKAFKAEREAARIGLTAALDVKSNCEREKNRAFNHDRALRRSDLFKAQEGQLHRLILQRKIRMLPVRF